MVACLLFMFSGCVGPVTGLEYKTSDFVIVYKVIKSGVVTFMTPEQIAQAKLDKINIVVTDTYKIVGNAAAGDLTETPSTK